MRNEGGGVEELGVGFAEMDYGGWGFWRWR